MCRLHALTLDSCLGYLAARFALVFSITTHCHHHPLSCFKLYIWNLSVIISSSSPLCTIHFISRPVNFASRVYSVLDHLILSPLLWAQSRQLPCFIWTARIMSWLVFWCLLLPYNLLKKKKVFIYLFIFGCAGSSLLHAGLVVMSRGYSLLWCTGFSLWCLLLLRHMGSRVFRLQYCDAACGIFLGQEWNQCPLHWQVDSFFFLACQAPQSMTFSRQEYWSGLPFPSPGRWILNHWITREVRQLILHIVVRGILLKGKSDLVTSLLGFSPTS